MIVLSKDAPSFSLEMEAYQLKGIIMPVSKLVDEAKFTIKKSGLLITAVDPAHVAMVVAELKSNFITVKTTKPGDIGVDLDWLIDCLKQVGQREVITLKTTVVSHVSDDQKTMQDIVMLNFQSNGYSDSNEPIDISSISDPKVPKLNLPTTVKMLCKQFEKVIKSMKNTSDHVVLTTGKDSFTVKAEGDTRQTVCKLSSEKHDLSVKGPEAKSLYPMDYIHNMAKSLLFLGRKETITLLMGVDYPVDMSVKTDYWSIKFLLAPRIESD